MQEASAEPSSAPEIENEDEWEETWEDLSNELEIQEPYASSEDSSILQNQDRAQRQPSFEVLPAEYPILINPEFLKIKENVFAEQQTTFAFRNMNSDHCSIFGKKIQNMKWMTANHDEFSGERVPTRKIPEKRRFARKNRKFDGVDFIVPSAGMALGLFATNVLSFVLGFSLGWLSRDSVPTLAVYEFHLDPNLI